jgi:hypothetical protein
MAEFVPPDFKIPLGLATSGFVLEPLGPQHNEQDYEAWTSSLEHIGETPGFPWGSWLQEMQLQVQWTQLGVVQTTSSAILLT